MASGGDTSERLRLERNLHAEEESAALYEALAVVERDAQQAEVLRQLASAERRHAAFWAERLRAGGHAVPRHRVSLRGRLLATLARGFGVAVVAPSITVREMRDRDSYVGQDDAERAGLAYEEHGHAAIMRSRTDDAFANNLRAAVLGANDGLVSNFCLLMGVAGGGAQRASILLTGVAGLVGGACAMALGEWLSVTNARELALSQMDRVTGEGRCVATAPAGEAGAGNALSAAGFSFALFALGALVPLLPFALPGAAAVRVSVAASLAASFLLGIATSLFNARDALYSGLRQAVVAAAAAVMTYFAGRIVGLLAGG